MSDASMTNIQMVRPKGPKVFLAVLGLGLAAGAAYYFTRPSGPVGEPEDPRKILVVTELDDVAKGLGSVGFSAEQGSFDALAAAGTEQGASGPGIEAILHLADVRGFGYVALHQPKERGITGLTVTADSAAIEDGDAWAVFSVGELGSPPKVTKDPDPSVLPLPPYVQILRAAFLQERLAGTLFADSQLPMNAVELKKAIEPAIDLHAAYALLDRRVTKEESARTEALVDGERAQPQPTLLAEPLEHTRAMPLADGTVLSLVRGWSLHSPWDTDVTIEEASELRVWYQPAAAGAPRKPCDALRGGMLPVGVNVVLAAGGDAVLIEDVGGIEQWALDVKAGACAFRQVGRLPQPTDGERNLGTAGPSDRLVRLAFDGPTAALHLWRAGQQEPERTIALPGCTSVGRPIWLDAEHLAISCAFAPPEVDDYEDDYDDYDDEVDPEAEPLPPAAPPPPEQSWIYVVQRDGDRIVAIPGTSLGDHVGAYTLHALPRASGLGFLATRPWSDEVIVVKSDRDAAGLLAAAEPTFAALEQADAALPTEPTTGAVPPDGAAEPTPAALGVAEPEAPLLRPAFVPVGSAVAALRPETVTASTVQLQPNATDLAVSPDGKRVVYVSQSRVLVTELDGGSTLTLSDASRADHDSPRFTVDGRTVVFNSSYRGEDGGAVQVGRLATLP